MDDASNSLAFRRLVMNIVEKLTEDEIRKLVYIRLYTQREALFRDANRLDIFVALECAGVFSPSRPEGLLSILENDLNHRQLAQSVRDFMRQKKRKSVGDLIDAKCGPSEEIEADSHLRMCYKVALAQTNVLVKHLDSLRQVVSRGKVERKAAQEAVENISKIAEALSKLREKAIEEDLYDGEEDYYDNVESRNPVFKEATEDNPFSLVQVKFNDIPPPPTKKKPELKPKPKLKVMTRNALSSGFVSTKSSSLPLLDSNSRAPQPTDDEEVGSDDYINPIDYTCDGFDGEPSRGELPPNPTLPNKANSLPFLNHPSSVSQVRPLPEPPNDKQDEYIATQPDEDYEPIYDDITEHTLLSRMGKTN